MGQNVKNFAILGIFSILLGSVGVMAPDSFAEPVFTCPAGMEYNNDSSRCEKDPHYPCPDGTSYNGVQCIGNPDVGHDDCPATTFYQSPACVAIEITTECPAGYEVISGYCVGGTNEGGECDYGFYDEEYDLCFTDIVIGCPSDTSYDGFWCTSDPDVGDDDCPSETTYNGSKCVADAGDPLCFMGEYDSENMLCFAESINQPPTIAAPEDKEVECTGETTIVDLGTPTASDPEEGDLVITNDPDNPFPVGQTIVTWTATDDGGLLDESEQTVDVLDTGAPDIIVPEDMMVIANTDGGWSGDIGEATAEDLCDPTVDVEPTEDIPEVFPVGDTTIEWCATDDSGNETCDEKTITVKPLPIEIDIKPASDPNSINPKSNGLVPVAILGTESFDVSDVDVTTLTFGPSGAEPAHDLEDSDVYDSHLEDVIVQDTLTDLLSHYHQKDTGLASGDTEACLSGETLGGIPFEGCDSVKVK